MHSLILSSAPTHLPSGNYCSAFCVCFCLVSVQLLSSVVQLFATPWTVAHQGSLSITNSQSPPKPMSIELVMPSNHLILCHPLLLLPSTFPSIRVSSNESVLPIRWPKYWSFSCSISPSNEYRFPLGLISFRMDWFGLLAVQGTLCLAWLVLFLLICICVYVSPSDISLSVIPTWSVHVTPNSKICSFYDEILCYIHIDFLNYSPVNGHLGYFHIWLLD